MRALPPIAPETVMQHPSAAAETILRAALESNGHHFTEQRAAVFRFLRATRSHPTADEVFLRVREEVPGISLATVYKGLETLVGCGLAAKLTYGDGSARYDGRTDEHHHIRCVECGCVVDLPGRVDPGEVDRLQSAAQGFTVTGYRLELTGYCPTCPPESSSVRA